MSNTKPYSIRRDSLNQAFESVKRKGGAAGVDGQTTKDFETKLEDNLYKIWNRMSSGTYFPSAVKAVEIAKKSGGTRMLGIPTVGDRVAQATVKMHLEPLVEPMFHPDSYGYRPNRSAKDAIATTRKRCWEFDWVIDLDIKQFFDDLDHQILMSLVRKHADTKWIELYIERWLTAPIARTDGTLVQKEGKGSPQGAVISPLLANIFMHYAFDEWMKENNPTNPFARYADDVIVHCRSQREAENLLESITAQLREWKLEVNLSKTRIVYCRDDNRKGPYKPNYFTFMGYDFKQRKAKSDRGVWMNFSPAVSRSAVADMREEIRSWRLGRRSDLSITEIAGHINKITNGWINYYGAFHKSALRSPLVGINDGLMRWMCRKYKRYRHQPGKAKTALRSIYDRSPGLFAHWKVVPPLRWISGAV